MKKDKELEKLYHKYKIKKYEYLIGLFVSYIGFHQSKLKKLTKK